MTFIAPHRHDAITALWLIDGEIFRTYIAQILAPTLRQGDIVILDYLGSHKATAIRRAIRAVGAKLFFLWACLPDLNPIEQVFATLKHLLRNAAEQSKEAVWRRIGTLFETCTPKEAKTTSETQGVVPWSIVPL